MGKVRDSARGWIRRVLNEVRRSFSEDYTPTEIAGSFAIGVFITMLPTLGTGVLVFFVLIYLSDRINRIALFSSLVVLNPVVKWGVYASSLALGFYLLGPINGVGAGDIGTQTGSAVIIRLLVGNTILAVIATVIGYVIVHRLASRYQREMEEMVEAVVDEVEADMEDFQPAE